METRQHKAQIGKNNGVRFGTRRRLLNSLVVLLCAAGPALALPTGSNPVVGITQNQIVTNGNIMTITNNSAKAIVDWNTFSIATGETVKIDQTAQSVFLSRVTGGVRSDILGTLQSDGKVFLINRNGIVFGAGAVINVNGLVASTLNITNEDFLAGKMKFSAGPVAGTVENKGTISTPSGGQVYLIAPDVQNSGVITAPNGDILLAAGREILLVDSATPEIAVVVSAPEHQAINLGTLTADAGRIGLYGGIVRQKGIVSANSAVRDASGRIFLKATKEVTAEAGSITSANGPQGGSVTLQASEGTTLVSGTVEAKGSEGTGGTVQVLGQYAGLFDSALVDTSGTAGGGTVLLGGDYQGKNAAVQNALATYMGKDAVIKADATVSGNGGKVVVWSDNATRAYGTISVQGGTNGGSGGFIETSGHWLDVEGIRVNARAPLGKTGLWLLDPTNIYIAVDQATATAAGMVGADTSIDGSGPFSFVASGAVQDSLLTTSTLQATLIGGAAAVSVSTANASGAGVGDIKVVSPVNWDGATGALTLTAAHDILIGASLQTAALGGGDITLTAGNAISLNAPIVSTYNASLDGIITLTAGSGGITNGAGAIITAKKLEVNSGGSVTLNNANVLEEVAANVTGTFRFVANNPFAVTTVGSTSGITVSGGNVYLETTAPGAISVNNQINAGNGKVELKGYGITFGAGSSAIGDEIRIVASGAAGVNLTGGTIGDTTYTRQVSFETNSIYNGGMTSITTSASDIKNEIHFSPYTANATIGVAGGSGTLNVDSTVLGIANAPTLVFGNEAGTTTPAGNITVNPFSWVGGNRQRVALLSAGTVSGNGIDSQQLGVIAGGAVNLTGNNLSAIAIESASGGVTFTNSTASFTVTSATGGITDPRTITGVSSGGANITLGTVSSGDITFAAPVNAGTTGVVTLNAAGKLLNGSGGVNIYGASLSAQAALGIGTNTLSLMTKTPLWSSVSSSSGSIYLDNTGAVQTGSLQVSALSGEVKLSAHSPLTIGTGGVQAGSDITLEASPMGGLDDLTINGAVTSSSGNIYLRAGNQIFENALVSALNGSITRTPFLNGMLVPPNLQPQPPSAPLYSDDEVPAGLVLVSLEEQGDSEEDKDKKYGTSQEDRTRSGDTQNAKPKKNYCN